MSDTDYIEDTPQLYDGNAIPVHIESYGAPAQRVSAPEYGSTMTYSIPTNQPLQILTRRYRREQAKIEVNFTAAGTVTFNNNPDHLTTGQGYVVTVPVAGLYRFPDWESQQPLYCVASVAGFTVMVLDESYAES